MKKTIPRFFGLLRYSDDYSDSFGKIGEDVLPLLKKFYNSEVYALFEDENTKMWHYSSHMIYEMFKSEIESKKNR